MTRKDGNPFNAARILTDPFWISSQNRFLGMSIFSRPSSLETPVRRLQATATPPALSLIRQARKNTNQMMPRIRTASPVEAVRSASTDGPGSPWRASVDVSTM